MQEIRAKGGGCVKSLDPTVKRETIYVAAVVLLLSVLMQAVFLVIGRWDLTVLWGNLLSGTAAVLNFLLLGITVQNAVTKEEKEAKTMIKASQSLRLVFLLVVAVIGAALPAVFHLWAVLIPLLFPRIAVMLHPLINRKEGGS